MRLSALILALLIMAAGCSHSVDQSSNSEKSNFDINASTEAPKYPRVIGADIKYCEGMGYVYDYRFEDGKYVGYCVLPDGSECESFDFISGLCHHEFTMCEIKGNTLKIAIEQYETYNISYAVCVFPDGSYCSEVDFFNRECHVKW